MTSEQHSNGDEPKQERLSESWREVGDQIQGLVSRIAGVFRVAWTEERSSDEPSDEESRRFDEDLRSSAERMERIFRRVASDTEEERAATMKSTRKASDQTLSEMRVVAARGLRALNEQLDDLAKTLERERAAREHEQSHNGNSDETHV